MTAYGFDSYNQIICEETTEPLRSAEGGDTKPKVLVIKDDSNIDRQMESDMSHRGNVDAPNDERNRRG